VVRCCGVVDQSYRVARVGGYGWASVGVPAWQCVWGGAQWCCVVVWDRWTQWMVTVCGWMVDGDRWMVVSCAVWVHDSGVRLVC
jgi:hypothetical protein